MIITITSYKGGVGKTTTAIHLAAYLQRLAPTLLVDGDAIRTATKWRQRGADKGLPFKVVTHAQMVSHIRDYQHIVIDTEGNPSDDDFKDLVPHVAHFAGCRRPSLCHMAPQAGREMTAESVTRRTSQQLRPARDSRRAGERGDGWAHAHPRQASRPRKQDPSGVADDG